MVWKKINDKQWKLYLDGKPAGDIVLVKYNNGKTEYQGQAWSRELRKISTVVKGSKITPVKAKIERLAKIQRR